MNNPRGQNPKKQSVEVYFFMAHGTVFWVPN